MADNLNPTGPSQPTLNQAYSTTGNPAQTNPAEESQQSTNASSEASGVADQRIPQKQTSSIEEGTFSSLGHGIHGAPSSSADPNDQDRSNELTAEQMGAPGEGAVSDAVERKPGAGPGAPGLETDLDKKKAEQAPLREAVEEEKEKKVDVAGILGQRGGPAATSRPGA
ncbi:hypothetical protein K431DRAFT_316441 [Polychaeton citri CBS 116435]|uniref:Uncharacterized protein n=1 Tax=Polychaeton citri CBS 116435 TaxID=1314669 RepID=A0A9P4PX78_9PEZI|nr:hypothetical protein K431DRAFT_316441 [Polychaeton citri CBS 116435]